MYVRENMKYDNYSTRVLVPMMKFISESQRKPYKQFNFRVSN